MRKPWFWSCFRSLFLSVMSAALLLVLVGFPHIYGGVIIGGPVSEKLPRPVELPTQRVADR